MPVLVRCGICEKEEMVPPSRAKRYATCSKSCMGKRAAVNLDTKVELTCKSCGKRFRVKQSYGPKTKFCSRVCLGKDFSERYKSEGNPNYKALSVDSDGYPLRKGRLDRIDKVHIAVACEVLGISAIPKGYQVHHKDGDVFNNEPENLAVITTSEHRWLHHQFGLAVLKAWGKGEVSLDQLIRWSDNPIKAERLLVLNLHKQVGVVKSRELLESPEAGNQQPSHSGMDGRFND